MEAATKPPSLAPPAAARIREELEALVLADLLGPAGGPEEEVDEPRVSDRYCIGMLAPRRLKVDAGGDDELGAGTETRGEDGTAEPSTIVSDSLFPSSFGSGFALMESLLFGTNSGA